MPMATRKTPERLLTERAGKTKRPLPPCGQIIIIRMRIFRGVKWPTSNSRTIPEALELTLQWSIFRENPTIFLTFITRSVSCIACGTNKHSIIISEMWVDTQTDPTTVTLAAHARRGLTRSFLSNTTKYTSTIMRNPFT